MRASELIRRLADISEDYHTDPIIEIEESSSIDPYNGIEKINSETAVDIKFKRRNWLGYDAVIIRKQPNLRLK